MNSELIRVSMHQSSRPYAYNIPHVLVVSASKWSFFVLLACLSLGAGAAQVNITGPTGSVAFGTSVTVLPNNNIVVVDPMATVSGVTRAGAVYLYSSTGALISTLTGSSYLDSIGNGDGGGIVVVGTSNFVILSPGWSNGGLSHVGAATWVNGSTGLNGMVSPSNSLIGTSANDFVGVRGAIRLSSGNYVVLSSSWNGGAGAATWANGSAAMSAVVSTTNSLYGTTSGDPGDGVGTRATALTNGNYVVVSSTWNNNSANARYGATTWIDGSGPHSGPVTTANSLYGTTTGDLIGVFGVTALINGNYVVASGNWNNGTPGSGVGAATWGNGTSGTTGPVTQSNSLYGTTVSDGVASGEGRILALSNGNYVVLSSYWSGIGAATWGNGSNGVTGAVSTGNSLTGSGVGKWGIALADNGNYVARFAWGDGNGGTVGTVSASNALFGPGVGSSLPTALSDGNYLVASPSWANGSTNNAGAVTWGDGSIGTTGSVTAANSLSGTTINDQVGNGGGAAINNGAYVVSSTEWHNSVGTSVGAVTFVRNSGPYAGVVSENNSFIGTSFNDQVGFARPTSDGNYVVVSRNWQNSGTVHAGAVTLASGSYRLVGQVAAWNSVLGGVAEGGDKMVYDYDATHQQLVVGRPAENIVSLFTMNQIFAENFEP